MRSYIVRVGGRNFGLEVPSDHFNTPILIDDLADVVSRLALGPSVGVVHAAGPDAISRYEWACRIARAFGLDESLVHGVPMAKTNYACRPAHALLASELWNRFNELDDVVLRGIDEALLVLRAASTSRRDVLLDLSSRTKPSEVIDTHPRSRTNQ